MILLFKSAPDFEIAGSNEGSNTYSFGYKAKDAANNETTGNIIVNVKDVDDTPPTISGPGGKKTKGLEPV